MPIAIARPIIGMAACILLSSCAKPLTGGPVEWDHRTRHGSVVELVGADAASSALAECGAPSHAAEAGRYATVRYRGRRVHHVIVAMLPGDTEIQVGDKVELEPGNCAAGHLPRVGRVLESASRK